MPLLITRKEVTSLSCDAITELTASPTEVITKSGNQLTFHIALPLQTARNNAVTIDALRDCYRNALTLAEQNGCESIAIPLIKVGRSNTAKELAMQAALDEICEFLLQHDISVYLAVFSAESFRIREDLFQSVKQYINARYAERYEGSVSTTYIGDDYYRYPNECFPNAKADIKPKKDTAKKKTAIELIKSFFGKAEQLSTAIEQRDESFSEMLLRKIDEKGMTDAECYKKANIDRKLFSKIRSNSHYQPRKSTVVAFAIALKLPLDETKELMQKAGFALSHSSVFDIIVEYFIVNNNYNILEINEVLFAFDQSLLGS